MTTKGTEAQAFGSFFLGERANHRIILIGQGKIPLSIVEEVFRSFGVPKKNYLYRNYYIPWRDGKLPASVKFIQAFAHENKKNEMRP